MSVAWMYPPRRRARMVPSPGNAATLISTQTQAGIRLGIGGGPEAGFIEVDERQQSPWNRYENSNAAGGGAEGIDQRGDDGEAKEAPPVFRDHLPADFHRRPELQLAIHDQ